MGYTNILCPNVLGQKKFWSFAKYFNKIVISFFCFKQKKFYWHFSINNQVLQEMYAFCTLYLGSFTVGERVPLRVSQNVQKCEFTYYISHTAVSIPKTNSKKISRVLRHFWGAATTFKIPPILQRKLTKNSPFFAYFYWVKYCFRLMFLFKTLEIFFQLLLGIDTAVCEI